MMDIVFIIQLITTLIFLGMISAQQLVQYPSLLKVKENFVAIEKLQGKRTVCLFAPIMTIDLVANIILTIFFAKSSFAILITIALALNIVIWLLTFFFKMPCHKKLCKQFSKPVFHKLVRVNWIRGGAWLIKTGCILAVLILMMR